MRTKIITVALALVLVGFITLAVTNIRQTNQKIQWQNIELKSRETRLIELNQKYDEVIQLQTKTEKEKLEKLEKIQELESERERLEAELQAKRHRQAEEQEKLARAAQNASGTRTASAAGGSGSCEAEIAKYGWNQSTALAVARAESGLRPGALNNNPATRDYSVGCFQINLYGANARNRPSEAALKNAATNVAFAYQIYVANGHSFKGQWGVCRHITCY